MAQINETASIDPTVLVQAKSLIDYYAQTQAPSWVSYLSIAAIVVAIFTVWASLEQASATERSHIRTEWNSIVDTCLQYPDFIDVYLTSNYRSFDPKTRLIYNAFSYKLWSLFDYIIERRLQNSNPYNAIILWSTAFHREWIIDNPFMFSSKRFWETFNAARNEPLTIFRNPVLPRLDAKPIRPDADRYSDCVDWDRVSSAYHDLIISPWAPCMMEARDNSPARNPLIEALRKSLKQYSPEELKQVRILDFGCGPGNLIEHLPSEITEIYGLDISQKALDIAREKAVSRQIVFHAIQGDMREYKDSKKFDFIISSNSVLPSRREDVLEIFKKIEQNLKPRGQFLAILPSFDTCEALMGYWGESYRKKAKRRNLFSNNGLYIQSVMTALESSKKLDPANHSFADDGVHSQCFHTPQTIEKEMTEANLQIEGDLQKVEYPWDYAKRFDYGYFPDKPEIWDWFVKAQKGSN